MIDSAACLLAVLLLPLLVVVAELDQVVVQLDTNDESAAREIAARHQMKYLTRLDDDDGLFLFGREMSELESANSHERRKKRAADSFDLNADPHIKHIEHQDPKIRVKRDFVEQERMHTRLSRRTDDNFNDPLYKEQWYLVRGSITGQTLNVEEAWRKGYTGKGVAVTILDDGLQIDHPDLAQNVDRQASTDLNSFDSDPTPTLNRQNAHGTRCASVVASVAGNGICNVGIAYNASIGGIRMLDGSVTDGTEAAAVSLNPDHVDIYSASWGPDDGGTTWDGPGPLTESKFRKGAERGRNGLGNIYVWASGNGAHKGDSCSFDGYSTNIHTLSIASASYREKQPWYSEACPSVIAATFSSGDQSREPQVCAADVPRGCTKDHTGTSASAPMAAGIVALMLDANSRLTWRDVQHIVVRSSNPSPLLSNPGWQKNGAGLYVSSAFGYGVMDAGRAVTLAERWRSVPSQKACKVVFGINDDAQNLRGEAFRSGKNYGLDIAEECSNVRYLEHVLLTLDAPYVFSRGDLEVSLTSPMGTESIMMPRRPKDTRLQTLNESKRWPIMSVQYWGEQPRGRWLLRIRDAGNGYPTNRLLIQGVTLTLYGTSSDPGN